MKRNGLVLAWIILQVGLVSSVSAQAPAPSASSAPAAGPEMDPKLVQMMIKDLAPMVRKAGKPFKLFHYNPLSSTGMTVDTPLHSKTALDYIHSKSERFWQKKDVAYSGRIPSLYGEGLYLAADPMVSADYGEGSGFSLLELLIAADAKIFDLASHQGALGLSDSSKALLESKGCTQADTVISFMDNPICKAYFNLAMSALHVELISYNYRDTKIAGCKFKNSAFVLIDPNLIHSSQVSVLSDQMTFKDPAALQEARMIYKLKEEGNIDSSNFPGWSTKSEVTSITTDPKADHQLAEWKKKNLLFCQQGVTLPVAHLKEASTDQVILEAIAESSTVLARVNHLTGLASLGCPSTNLIREPRVVPTDGEEKGQNLKYCDGISVCVFAMNYLKVRRPGSSVTLAWSCTSGNDPKPNPKTLTLKFDAEESFILRCP